MSRLLDMTTIASSALTVRTARTTEPDAFVAVQALERELDTRGASAVLLFCSPSYDLLQLGSAIERAFSVPVSACTTAGQFGPNGFESGGITAVCLFGDLTMTPIFLPAISHGTASARLPLSRTSAGGRRKAFGVLFSDGLSCAEEYLAASLYQALGDVPLVGGSAGDDGAFEATTVYHAGQFHSDAAVLALFETDSLPFATFRAHYLQPGSRRLVTTLADPERRIIYELNGEPAARAYAEMLDVEPANLEPALCATRPLLLSIGERSYVRSVKSCNADQSLSLFCAIEEGLVLSIAEPREPLAALREAFDGLPRELARAPLVLAFDTFLDRVLLDAMGQREPVSRFLAERGVRGFSGYGSQLGPIHFNQTLIGIAVGGATADLGDAP